MPEGKTAPVEAGNATEDIRGVIERIAQEGARKLLQAALEAEVEKHLARYERVRDGKGRRAGLGNGHAPERTILSGVGPVVVRRPRVDERSVQGREGHEPFTSAILPRFLRRTPSLEGALATL